MINIVDGGCGDDMMSKKREKNEKQLWYVIVQYMYNTRNKKLDRNRNE